MLLIQDMQRQAAAAPNRLLTANVRVVEIRAVFRAAESGMALAGVQHHISARRDIHIVRENVGNVAQVGGFKRAFAQDEMSSELNAHRALILEEQKLLVR